MARRGPLAKITPPRVPGTLARRRLFRLIDRLRGHPGVWIAGPAGSGKTTLLSSYLAEREEAVLWYQIDDGDADPAAFFYYLGLAVRRAAPRRRRAMPLLTPEHVPALPTFARNFFRQLFDRMPGAGVLVFDNFQALPEDSATHALFQIAMEEVPEEFTVVFLSREVPPPSMRKLQGEGRLAFIGWKELRLDDREAAAIVRLRAFPAGVAQKWMRTADGWVAGLVLLMEWARIEGELAMDDTAPVPEYIFDYFAGQILDVLPDAQRLLLLESAFLPVMSERMLEGLTGRGGAGRFLAGLTRTNYFTTRHGGSPITYQYHPLFRAFLLDRACREFGETRLRALQSRAASVLEADGDYAAAADYLVRLGDWAGLERLLEAAAPLLLRQGRHLTVLGWLAAVPEAEAGRRPWLRYWHGEALLFIDPQRALPLLEAAWQQFDERDDARGLYLTWAAAVQSFIVIRLLEGSKTWLERLRPLRRRHPEFESPLIEARTVLAAYQLLSMTVPDDRDSSEWESRALALLQSEAPADLRLLAASYLLLWHTSFGGSREIATRAVDVALRLLPTTDITPMAAITWRSVEGLYYFWYGGSGAEHSVLACVEHGLALADEHGLHAMDPWLLASRIYLHLAEDDHRAARSELERMSRLAVPITRIDESHLLSMRAWCEWTAGHLAAASELVDLAVATARETGAPNAIAYSTFGRALIEAARGRDQSALRGFAQTRQLARRCGYRSVLFMCRLAEAQHALEHGRRARGRALLRGALAMGAAERRMRMPFIRKRDLAQLCVEALECGIETEYAQELVRERDLRPDPPPIAVVRWPWRVEIRCLGDWSVLVAGEPLGYGRKAPRRTLDLLKAVIALGGRQVPETKLLDALWPDDDGDSARNALSTALHRLRRLLGSDVLLQGDGRIGIDAAAVWVDAWAFEHLADAAHAAGRAGSIDDMMQDLRRALKLYRGHFLDGMSDAPWAEAARERLRSRFTHEVGRMGEHFEEVGAWGEAGDLYRRALELDDLVEAHYQGLLRCYQQLGLRAEAAEIWRRCRGTFTRQLGIDPSPATEKLYRAVTGAVPFD